ncbi:hypothetical protein JF544_02780 [Halobacillus kuroshimensis]|uniref:TMhelix containing protein n=1 Tax=Halobacillus kuroshimensis TaxID=302481 RepID=A0ABS3DS24_9BACI|nr:hypothetical protein [Halobacillus kuroshimensis]MBN8234150.1 hypothetical protein [Halobacillus kuroshimensis]
MKNYKDTGLYAVVVLFIYLCFFGFVWLFGALNGADWSSWWVGFSWDMVNTKELKQIIGL